MASARGLTLLFRRSVVATRATSALQRGGVSPPIPPFARIPVPSQQVRSREGGVVVVCGIWNFLLTFFWKYIYWVIYIVDGKQRYFVWRWCRSRIGIGFWFATYFQYRSITVVLGSPDGIGRFILLYFHHQSRIEESSRISQNEHGDWTSSIGTTTTIYKKVTRKNERLMKKTCARVVFWSGWVGCLKNPIANE